MYSLVMVNEVNEGLYLSELSFLNLVDPKGLTLSALISLVADAQVRK